jgi:hypothetical protein
MMMRPVYFVARVVGVIALISCQGEKKSASNHVVGESDFAPRAPNPQHVILITTDALRADMLSCYRAGRKGLGADAQAQVEVTQDQIDRLRALGYF